MSSCVLLGATAVVLSWRRGSAWPVDPSDVLAGWCLGVITDGGVLLVVAFVRHRTDQRMRR